MLSAIERAVSPYVTKEIFSTIYKISKFSIPVVSTVAIKCVFNYFVENHVLENTQIFKNFQSDFCKEDGIHYFCGAEGQDKLCNSVNAMLYLNDKIEIIYNFTNIFDYSE